MSTQDFEYNYKIVRRKAVRIEKLEPKQMIKYYENSIRPVIRERKEPNRICVRCGNEADVFAFFKVDRKGTLVKEKYCPQCLDKWVYLPSSAELSGDTCYSCK